MSIDQTVALIASLLTIVSFCANIIQYNNRKSLVQRLRSFAQGTYMDHYMIARACSRLRNPKDESKPSEVRLNIFCREIFYINGISDAARNNIIAVAEEHLGLTPKFRHPAFPEKADFEEDIKLGTPPLFKMFESSEIEDKHESDEKV